MSVPYNNPAQHSGSRSEEVTSARVLVVDDNLELLDVLREILRFHGYDPVVASSAERALQLLTEQPADIILCDVMMPGKDGFALFQEIRQNTDWIDIPFIFLTSLTGREEVNAGKGCGCDDYLTKPFDPDELLAVVKGKLALAAKRRRGSKTNFESYRKRIIHTLSHEFRTPLVSINTGAELLLDQRDLKDAQARRLLESIQRGGFRLERLVNDFMLLQQIDLGHAATSCERFRRKQSLHFLLESAIEGFQECFPKSQVPKNIKLDVPSKEAGDAQADVYDVQVAHVIQHLLSNALKFGGETNPIEVSLERSDGTARILIRDYGPGMDQRAIDRACELFTQIDRDTVEQQGAGLGLTISRYFTQINQGKLTFRSPAEGQGLVAELSFQVE